MTDTELALLVAKAAGIEVELEYLSIKGGKGYTRCLRSGTTTLWNPTDAITGWNDAMEAAKKVGLFDDYYLYKNAISGLWSMRNKVQGNKDAAKGCASGFVAICEAIVALKGGE